jgi:hypothetical protein
MLDFTVKVTVPKVNIGYKSALYLIHMSRFQSLSNPRNVYLNKFHTILLII